MPDNLEHKLRHIPLLKHFSNYFDAQERRLVLRSIIIGVVVWAIVYSLKVSVHWLFDELILPRVESSASLFVILLPLVLGALLMMLFVKHGTSTIHYRDNTGHIHPLVDVEGDGLERAIALYYTSEPTLKQALLGKEGVDVRWELPTFSLALRKFGATLATLGSGGSGGLEASVTLIGESVSAGLFKPRRTISRAKETLEPVNWVWRWWQSTDPDDLQTAQLGGIAAAVSTLLGAPFAAAFFATEVMYRRRPLISKLVYSLIPSLIAFFLSEIVGHGPPSVFHVAERIVPPNTLVYYLSVVLMAFIISLVALSFRRLRDVASHGFRRFMPHLWMRHVAGALLTGLIALAVVYLTGHEYGLDLVLGTGEAGIDAALLGELSWKVAMLALVGKMLATLATIESGGSAGLLVPSVFFGTMVAAGMADMLGQFPPMALIVPAMTASLVSIVNVPLAAILFAVEVFGASYMVPALIALVAASILAHEGTIYRSQRERVERRQILPGYGVRRFIVPPHWDGRTLIEMDVRKRFGLNVIGVVEQRTQNGRLQQQVRLEPPSSQPMHRGDVMVVLGEEAKLDAFEADLQERDGSGQEFSDARFADAE